MFLNGSKIPAFDFLTFGTFKTQCFLKLHRKCIRSGRKLILFIHQPIKMDFHQWTLKQFLLKKNKYSKSSTHIVKLTGPWKVDNMKVDNYFVGDYWVKPFYNILVQALVWHTQPNVEVYTT